MTGAGNASVASTTGGGPNDRTDSAIAVQSELQRAFISMSKDAGDIFEASVGDTLSCIFLSAEAEILLPLK